MGYPERKRPSEIPRGICEDNIKIDSIEMGWDYMD
jgi:hypothetical protein